MSELKKKKQQKPVRKQTVIESQPRAAQPASGLSKPVYAYALIVGLCLLVYSQTMWFGYSGFDDERLIRDNYPVLKDVSQIGKVVTSDVFLGKSIAVFYRPVQTLSYMLDTVLGGTNPSAYHASNVLLHCAMSCAVLYLFLLAGFGRTVSILLAALFAVHPVFVHSVSWLPSRGDILIGLFLVLSFVFYVRYSSQRTHLDLFLHMLFFTLAVFSKETAIVFPAVLLTYTLLENKRNPALRRTLPAAVCWILVLILWFVLRSSAVASAVNPAGTGLGALLFNIRAIPEFVSKFFVPVFLAPIPSYSLFGAVSGLLIILGLLVWAAVSKKLNSLYFILGAVWFLALLFPGLLYRLELGSSAYDYLLHRLYAPSVGIMFCLLALIPDRLFTERKWPVYAGAVVVVAAAVASVVLARNYRSPQAFNDYAVASNTKSAYAFNGRGNQRIFDGDLQGAVSDLNEALRIAPTYAIALYNRGHAYNELGLYKDAIADCSEALRLFPGYVDAYCNRGIAYLRTGNPAEAERDFFRAAELNPTDDKAISGRGIVKSMKGDFRGAVNDFNESLRLNPESPETYVNRGNAYRALRNIQEAGADFEKALQLKPGAADAYYGLANLQADAGNINEALKYFTKVIDANPSSATAYMTRGLFKFKLKDIAGALADMDKAVSVNPANPDTYGNRAGIRDAMGDYQNALRDYTEALRLNPRSAQIFKNRGIIKYKMKDLPGARADWSEAVNLGSPDAGALLRQYGGK